MACESAPAEEVTAGPTPPPMGVALFGQDQTEVDTLPEGATLDGLEVDPKSTRFIVSKAGKSYWVGVAHRDGVARPCLIAEASGLQGLVAGCGAPGAVTPVELRAWDFRALMVPDDHADPGDGWQRVSTNLYVRETTIDFGLAVLERKQTSEDVPPVEVRAHGGLKGLDDSSTRLVGAHGDTRFYIGVATRASSSGSNTETVLCFFADHPYPAVTMCGPPESYSKGSGELPLVQGSTALFVPDTHEDPGDGWVQAGPNLYVFEQLAS
ncbi:hypothetical protein [Georgenia thermotolerans]|uniref:Uncharacterized protein n=1 Tax=Georgenia thermotolerans TaxID=527326 RepID=A0A7J5UP14_9MICO|nr:hypothetical protein [Georgenia thermotolerans]KAE8764146.1 hypothetical protein GB883_10545 [Georgenia thermotolerans]